MDLKKVIKKRRPRKKKTAKKKAIPEMKVVKVVKKGVIPPPPLPVMEAKPPVPKVQPEYNGPVFYAVRDYRSGTLILMEAAVYELQLARFSERPPSSSGAEKSAAAWALAVRIEAADRQEALEKMAAR